ncbi:MAG: hypothetical protein OHK0045_07610 [Raineya sp.]
MFPICYGMAILSIFAQSPRIFLEFPSVVFEEKDYEISWKIEADKVKSVFLEKIVSGRKSEIIAKKLPLEGKYIVPFKKGTSFQITVETKKNVYRKRVSPKFVKMELEEFKANKYEIEKYESIKVFWKASKHTQISIISSINDKVVGSNLDANSSLTLRPDTTQYYKIVLEAPQTSIRIVDSFRVVVREPLFLNCSPVVMEEDSIEIRWSVPHDYNNLSLLELEKPFSDKQIIYSDTVSILKNFKYKIIKKDLPLISSITLPPLSKNKREVHLLLAAEDSRNRAIFLPKSVSLLEKGKEKVIEKKKNLPLKIEVSLNKKPVASGKYYTKYVVNQGDMVRLRWSVSNAASVSLIDFKGKKISNYHEGLKELAATHSLFFIIEAFSEKEDSIRYIVDIKVKGRRHFIKNVKDISQIPDNHRFSMEVIEVNRNLYPQKVMLKVIAYDSLGNFITGLGKDAQKYFKSVYENIEGKNISVTNFEVKEVIEQMGESKVIGVCTDYSGSMSGESIELAERALKIFIENKYEKDIISMNKFDGKVANVVKPTNSKALLLQEYKFVGLKDYGGGTALYAGADEALKSIEKLSSKEKYLILLTDGYENSSFQYFETHAFTGQLLVERARKLGVKLIVISLGEGTNEPLLQALAELTDGYYYNIDEPKNIIGAYQEIPRLFKHYYQISYTPKKFEGKRLLFLEYYDNNKTKKIRRNIQIGERFDIVDLDTQAGIGLRSGGNTLSLFPGKKLIVTPQTIANFEFNKSELEWVYISNVNKYVEFLQANPDTYIAILGHTDLKGEAKRQVKLSEERAEAIREQFIKKGIDASRIKMKGYGKTHPLWRDEQYEWQASENRRVEIAIYK